MTGAKILSHQGPASNARPNMNPTNARLSSLRGCPDGKNQLFNVDSCPDLSGSRTEEVASLGVKLTGLALSALLEKAREARMVSSW
jgi:hypothetical protein